MSPVAPRQKETLLIEILLSGLDIRTIANEADSPILAYIADLLVKRARDELDVVAGRVEAHTDGADD